MISWRVSLRFHGGYHCDFMDLNPAILWRVDLNSAILWRVDLIFAIFGRRREYTSEISMAPRSRYASLGIGDISHLARSNLISYEILYGCDLRKLGTGLIIILVFL